MPRVTILLLAVSLAVLLPGPRSQGGAPDLEEARSLPQGYRDAMEAKRHGDELVRAGRASEAEGEYRLALTLLEETFGPDATVLRRVLSPMASLWRSQGRFADAVEAHERTISILRKAEKTNTLAMALALEEYAITIREMVSIRERQDPVIRVRPPDRDPE
jgi:hypothetical protein